MRSRRPGAGPPSDLPADLDWPALSMPRHAATMSGAPGSSASTQAVIGGRWPSSWRRVACGAGHIAMIPTTGPRARMIHARRQPSAPVGSSSPTPRIVTLVNVNPTAVWTDRADPAVPGGASSETADENCAESATTVTPQTRATRTRRHGRPEQEPGDHRASAGCRQGRDRRRRAPEPVRDRPGDRASDATRRDDAERGEGGERRVVHAGGGEARDQEERDPGPHREELPHVPEVAEVDARRTDGSRNAAAAIAGENRGAATSSGPLRAAKPTSTAPATAATLAARRPGASRRPRTRRSPGTGRAARPRRVRAPMTTPDGQPSVAPEPAGGELHGDGIDRRHGHAGEETERDAPRPGRSRGARTRGWRRRPRAPPRRTASVRR